MCSNRSHSALRAFWAPGELRTSSLNTERAIAASGYRDGYVSPSPNSAGISMTSSRNGLHSHAVELILPPVGRPCRRRGRGGSQRHSRHGGVGRWEGRVTPGALASRRTVWETERRGRPRVGIVWGETAQTIPPVLLVCQGSRVSPNPHASCQGSLTRLVSIQHCPRRPNGQASLTQTAYARCSS